MKDNTIEVIFACNELLDHINNSTEDDLIEWKYKKISARKGPLHQSHPNHNGSPCNLQMEWENGEITSEALSIIAANNPVLCAIYARDNDLLEKLGGNASNLLLKEIRNC